MQIRAVVRAKNAQWSSVRLQGKLSWLFLALLAFFPLFLSARPGEKPSQPPKQDEPCVACHGQPDMKSEKGKSISIRPDQHAASVHGALACTDCHTAIKDFPHPAKIAKA